MDRRLDAGALLVAASAVLLVVSLFLDWFGLDGSGGASGWDVFEVLDLVLLAAAVAAVAAAFSALDSRLLLAAAGVAAVVVVSQLIQPPPAAQGADREIGAWLALVAVAGLLAGPALSAAQIAVTVDVRGRERRRRVPAVDKRGDEVAAPPDEPKPSADPFAPGSPAGGASLLDPDATQAFEAPRGEPER